MSKTLVIVEGATTCGSVRKHLSKNTHVCACEDTFTYGPLLDLPVLVLLRKRHRYWRRTVYQHLEMDRPRPLNGLPSMLHNSDRIEIWLGSSASEQLLLLGLNAWFRQEGVDLSRISTRQFDLQDGFPLSHSKIDSIPEATALTPDLSNWLASKWDDATAPTPSGQFSSAKDATSLPMQDAFGDLVSFFPDRRTGLGSIEQRLLSAASLEWTSAVRVVGNALAANRPIVGDLILFSRLADLSHGPQPAIELRGNPSQMRSCEARLTEMGATYLTGEVNMVASNGLDTWVGGVHLNSKTGNIWFRPS